MAACPLPSRNALRSLAKPASSVWRGEVARDSLVPTKAAATTKQTLRGFISLLRPVVRGLSFVGRPCRRSAWHATLRDLFSLPHAFGDAEVEFAGGFLEGGVEA